MVIPLLRTPDGQFENLVDFPFKANYIEINSVRIHYIDEGDKNGATVLLMHGEPSWSYLYRKMIPLLVTAGCRVIVPDLPGFGKSDKPVNRSDITYSWISDIFDNFVNNLDLQDITLFCQDWGGLIGLRVAALNEQRFSRVMAGNTAFPFAGGLKGLIGYTLFKRKLKKIGKITQEQLNEKPGFLRWVAFSQTVESFPIDTILQFATVRTLSNDELAAYIAPYPEEKYKEGPRIMPFLVPSELRINNRLWNKVWKKWNKPFMTVFSDADPITRGGEKNFLRDIPGTKRVKHITIENAGHFLQEDKPKELADLLIEFIKII